MNPPRTTDEIVEALAQAAGNWLAPGSPWRAHAVAAAPEPTGLSPEMIHVAIDLTFRALTREALRKLAGKLGAPRRIVHFLSGNVPAPGIGSLCAGLLAQATNVVKCSSRDPVFPALFIESLREVDAELASRVTVCHWPRTETGLTQATLAGADLVIAYGDDATIAALCALTPVGAQFIGYGHKLSVAVVGKEALTDRCLPALAAFDASVYDQQGCMSPHAFFVEGDARGFAGALAQAMEDYQRRVPRGRLSIEEAAASARLRETYEFRSATDCRLAVWSAPPPHPWTVIYEDAPTFTPSCLNRTVFVKPVKNLRWVYDALQPFTGKISTVGVAPGNTRITAELAKLGVARVCPIGQMQQPGLAADSSTGRSS